MDRINDPPATGQDTLTDNDHGILGSAGQNQGSKDDEDRILGGAPQAPGLTPGEKAQAESDKPDTDANPAQMQLDSGERSGGRLDSDAVGTDSPHTDTGAGSNNLTSVGGNRS